MSFKKQQDQLVKSKKIVKVDKFDHHALNKMSNTAKFIKDKRFQSAQYDPKFAAPKLNVGKVKIDKRFADKLESQKFKISGSTDKFGRKNKDNTKLGGMSEYYYTQDQLQNQVKIQKEQNKKGKKPKITKKYKDQDDDIDQQLISEQKNQNNISKWMKQYNQQSSSDMEDQDNIVQQSDSVWSDDKQNVIISQNVQVTNRLALCNYDWMNIGSKDLMLLFSSFKPNSGTILSVCVYYSELGKQKMEREEKFGPQGIWNQAQEENEQEQQSNRKKNKKLSQLPKSKRQQQAFNQKKLRAYEKQRLKYCYAIIECNSKKTADQIYKQCDGNQFQNSNTLFDLRFVPENIQFDPSMLKQKCDQIPVSGQVKNFVSRAMGHSKISLTWEDPELNSIASLKNKNWNKMTEKQMDNIDWGMYLNQQVQQANENMNKILKKGKKQKLSEQSGTIDWRSQCNKKYKKNKGQDDLQIVFPSGFDNKIETNKQKQSLNKQLKTRKQRWRQIHQQKKNRQQIQLLVEPSDKKQFKYDPNDDRFKAVLDNPQFYIDPSNPKFDHRKTGAVFEEVVKHKKKKNLL